jgi:hypothetical protein
MKDRNNFYKLLKKLNLKIGAELGVAKGYFSKILNTNHDFDNFFCIDKWNDHHDQKEKQYVEELFKNNTNIKIIQSSFEQAVNLFEDGFFDFIYIDGYAHTGQNEGSTLRQWYPKLKSGGIFAGHDFCQKRWPKTFYQINLFLKDELGYKIHTTHEKIDPSWYILKR